MRIAMVSEHASPLATVGGVDAGGQNVHVAALSSALADRGHEVVVYTRRDAPDLPGRASLRRGVTVVHLDAGPPAPVAKDDLLPFVPAFADVLAVQLAADRPSVVHAHFWMSGVAALRATSELRMPLVQTFHALGTVKRRLQGAEDTSPAQRIGLEQQVAQSVARIIATCTDEVAELVDLGAPRSRIDVIASGVDVDEFRPSGPVAPRSRRPRLVVVGRLVPRKGVDDAITALYGIPDAELLVAGGPRADGIGTDPEAQRLQRMAADLGLAHRLHLLGAVPRAELPALIRSADLTLCLPWYEPFGIVPLESMACGVPVVGSAVGGLLDTILDGVTGLLTPPRRPDLVSDAVLDLLHHPDRRAAFAAAGVERVHAQYRWASLARATERSYLRAISSASTLQLTGSTQATG